MEIGKINTAIFILLRNALFSDNMNDSDKENYENLDEADWNSILEELKSQTVAVIPCESVMQYSVISEEMKQKYMNLVYSQIGQWTKLLTAQNELVDLMKEHGIEMAIMKGCSAAMLYPHPEYRAMGDIDFIVPENKYHQACQLMLDNGYKFLHSEEMGKKHLKEDKFHHTELKKDGIVFELHRKLFDIQNETIESYIQSMVDEGLKNTEINTIENCQFPSFQGTLNGLVLLRHIVQHLTREGLGLRQILDWIMFADRYLDDDYWKNEFEPVVMKAGLKKAAIIFTRMCQIYLGLREENMTWCMEADTKLCEEWLFSIMAMGNFGRKIKSDYEGANVFIKNKNIITFLKSLQALGLEHWEMAQKYFILRPFAWIYQMCRYFRKAFCRKAPMRTLKADFTKSKERKNIINQLEIGGLSDKK